MRTHDFSSRDNAGEFYSLGKKAANEGKWKAAVDLFLRAAKLFEDNGVSIWAARAYGRVAWNCIPRGRLKEARKYLEKSIQLDSDQGGANLIWMAYLCLIFGFKKKVGEYFLRFVSMIFSTEEMKKLRKVSQEEAMHLIFEKIGAYYERLIEWEVEKYPSWASSDGVRGYMIRTELDLISDPYWLELSRKSEEGKLYFQASFCRAIYLIRFVLKTQDDDEILVHLDAVSQELSHVQLTQEGNDIVEFIKLVCDSYKHLIEAKQTNSKKPLHRTLSLLMKARDISMRIGEVRATETLVKGCANLSKYLSKKSNGYKKDEVMNIETTIRDAFDTLATFTFIERLKWQLKHLDQPMEVLIELFSILGIIFLTFCIAYVVNRDAHQERLSTAIGIAALFGFVATIIWEAKRKLVASYR